MLDLLILMELKLPLTLPDADLEIRRGPGHSDPEISGEPGLQKIFSDPSDLSLV